MSGSVCQHRGTGNRGPNDKDGLDRLDETSNHTSRIVISSRRSCSLMVVARSSGLAFDFAIPAELHTADR